MFSDIEELLEDPISMDAFYLEMRLSNDPDMSKHAEDYNLMVLDMVKGSNVRGGGVSNGLSTNMAPSALPQLI